MPPLAPKHRLPWEKPKTAARERERKAKVDQKRKEDPIRALYWTPEWKRESKAFLALPENRFCFCGCGRRSNMVHHVRGPRSAKSFDEAQRLFWSRPNWRPANRACNSRIAARSEGGFGNPVRDHDVAPGAPVRQPGSPSRPVFDGRKC